MKLVNRASQVTSWHSWYNRRVSAGAEEAVSLPVRSHSLATCSSLSSSNATCSENVSLTDDPILAAKFYCVHIHQTELVSISAQLIAIYTQGSFAAKGDINGCDYVLNGPKEEETPVDTQLSSGHWSPKNQSRLFQRTSFQAARESRQVCATQCKLTCSPEKTRRKLSSLEEAVVHVMRLHEEFQLPRGLHVSSLPSAHTHQA